MKIKKSAEQAYQKFVEINSDNGYSYSVVTYMNRWADLMEAEMRKGKSLPDIAEQTSHDANTDGITGFMYGCAVAALSGFWEYGEELRVWHNAQHGYHGDGVVNPAILTVRAKK